MGLFDQLVTTTKPGASRGTGYTTTPGTLSGSSPSILPASAYAGQDPSMLAAQANKGKANQSGQLASIDPTTGASMPLPSLASAGTQGSLAGVGAPVNPGGIYGAATTAAGPLSSVAPGAGTFAPSGAAATSTGYPDATTVAGADQAASNAAGAFADRNAGLYAQIQGTQNALTPDMIAAGSRAAFNSPFIDSNGAAQGALAAQNGGGHAGSYGTAMQDAVNAGAAVQAQANAANYGLASANQQNAFTAQKNAALNDVNNSSNQAFGDYANLLGQNQGIYQSSLNQQNLQNANYGQAAGGVLGALGNFAATPVGQGLVTAGLSAVGVPLPVSAAAAGAVGAAGNAAAKTKQPAQGGLSAAAPTQYRGM